MNFFEFWPTVGLKWLCNATPAQDLKARRALSREFPCSGRQAPTAHHARWSVCGHRERARSFLLGTQFNSFRIGPGSDFS